MRYIPTKTCGIKDDTEMSSGDGGGGCVGDGGSGCIDGGTTFIGDGGTQI